MAHAHGAGFRPGDRWLECDRCGFDYRLSQMKREWNGLVVCGPCHEERHPQDFIRPVEDRIAPFGPIRTPKERFITRYYDESEFNDEAAVAGIAVTGKAVAGTSATRNVSLDSTIPTGTWGADL